MTGPFGSAALTAQVPGRCCGRHLSSPWFVGPGRRTVSGVQLLTDGIVMAALIGGVLVDLGEQGNLASVVVAFTLGVALVLTPETARSRAARLPAVVCAGCVLFAAAGTDLLSLTSNSSASRNPRRCEV